LGEHDGRARDGVAVFRFLLRFLLGFLFWRAAIAALAPAPAPARGKQQSRENGRPFPAPVQPENRDRPMIRSHEHTPIVDISARTQL
ncbi:MAG TPA: hypothetical protein VJ325_02530, partial [Thiobacillus sp.]|nr:hypothetical protein [Thiobacillus sp.]